MYSAISCIILLTFIIIIIMMYSLYMYIFRKQYSFCCCCSKVLRRHMAHRPSTSFMSVLYNLAKWLFLYSVYFSSLFFLLCSSFFSPSVHTQLFTIELFTMVLITCELIYIPFGNIIHIDNQNN